MRIAAADDTEDDPAALDDCGQSSEASFETPFETRD